MCRCLAEEAAQRRHCSISCSLTGELVGYLSLLSTVPTLWARLRAVTGSGGGRPLRHSPLGGGRAVYEGVQRPSGLELASYLPHSHIVPVSDVPSLWPCSRSADRCHMWCAGALRWAPGPWAAAVDAARPHSSPMRETRVALGLLWVECLESIHVHTARFVV